MHRAFTDPRTGLNTSARTEHQQRTHSDALARTAQNEHTSIRQALAAPVLMSLTICLLIPVVLPIVLAQALVQNILIAYLLLSTAACLVAALCLLADAPSSLTGIGHLRGHETDRLAALAAETARVGGRVQEGADRLDFTPVPWDALHPAVMDTYQDHRLATFAAVVGLAVEGVRIRDVATTAKTMPDFPALWTELVGGA